MQPLKQDAPPVAGVKTALSLYARLSAEVDRALPKSLGKKTERRIISDLALYPDSTDADLVRALGLQKSQGSLVIHSLVEQGLILSKDRPGRQLQQLRYLSPAGIARAEEIRVASSIAMAAALRNFDIADQMIVMGAANCQPDGTARGKISGPIAYRPIETADWPWVLSQVAELSRLKGGYLIFDHVLRGAGRFAAQNLEWEFGWIAHQGEVQLGCCLVVLTDDPTVGECVLCIVTPKARGQKIGRTLIDKCASKCRERDMHRIYASAMAYEPFVRTLIASGFSKEKIFRSGRHDPGGSVRYVRELVWDGSILDE